MTGCWMSGLNDEGWMRMEAGSGRRPGPGKLGGGGQARGSLGSGIEGLPLLDDCNARRG